jgi:ribosomal RNA assembly protein
MQEEIKISKERIAVLIGEKGVEKRKLQKQTSTKIKISSKEGDVLIEGEDSLMVIIVRDIIKAISRGFNPKIAHKLLKEENMFDLLNIQDYSGNSKKQEIRIKSRVIGKEGRARKTIERFTNTNICVYGKTVGIIGKIEDVSLARRALDKLLKGSPHGKVYSWIKKQEKEIQNL